MPTLAGIQNITTGLNSVDFVRFLERTRTLDRLEVIWQRERSLVGTGDPVIIKAGSVSAGFFDLLGGRTILDGLTQVEGRKRSAFHEYLDKVARDLR